MLKGHSIKLANINKYNISQKALTGEYIKIINKIGQTYIKVKKKHFI